MHLSRLWSNFKYMSQEDNNSLNVVIGGINLRVHPKEYDQPKIEQSVAQIHARLKDIQLRYPDIKLEEALAMTLLSMMVKKSGDETTGLAKENFLRELDQMESILDRILQ